ncbi:hypothetical protein BN1317_10276 [Staphylococcus capitis]|nr:hypothetical protein CR01_140048 [Staphylococcus capitis CR01]CQD25648.1 hypothetical protein SCAPIOD10125 [Staphylococcus capitis]CUT93826.1 hypothetical protein BN1317_10276 [Staphylococcus capitis]
MQKDVLFYFSKMTYKKRQIKPFKLNLSLTYYKKFNISLLCDT